MTEIPIRSTCLLLASRGGTEQPSFRGPARERRTEEPRRAGSATPTRARAEPGLVGGGARRYRDGVGGNTGTPRPRLWHLLLLLPLAAIALWIGERGRRLRDDPADVLRHLKAQQAPTLPAAAAAGAGERSAMEQYDRETLYDFIDGAAEAYIAHGFERCAAATYTFAGAGGAALEVAAEVYRFAAPEGAAAQLAAERPASGSAPAELPGAVTDGSVLLLADGRDLLKLTSLARGGGAAPELLRIAGAWHEDRPR